ncbi:hypothetical protein [Devosia sediminis]|uniref:Lysine-specific metallo-endopeptidase domain-containing protein n=1 Tax=Devosia sediminis TaxID=2798801 RepID=A0A934J000_9HYPH|nr:hypothetical protein [Devosia sediminis]MBJ3785803.1 hypothetical protein [Devosia sediminis]
MRLPLLAMTIAGLLFAAPPARADAALDALNDAIAAFSTARAQLPGELAGVDVAAYGDALTLGRFTSAVWGGEVLLDLYRSDGGGACGRYAAFVDLPPRDGVIRLALCPQFSAEGTPALRRLTILHEMVHVVAGADECQAMAFAARIEVLSTGAHTPVDSYWQANGCARSGFSLP